MRSHAREFMIKKLRQKEIMPIRVESQQNRAKFNNMLDQPPKFFAPPSKRPKSSSKDFPKEPYNLNRQSIEIRTSSKQSD